MSKKREIKSLLTEWVVRTLRLSCLCMLSMVWPPVSEGNFPPFCRAPPTSKVRQCAPTRRSPASSGKSFRISYDNQPKKIWAVKNQSERSDLPLNTQHFLGYWILKHFCGIVNNLTDNNWHITKHGQLGRKRCNFSIPVPHVVLSGLLCAWVQRNCRPAASWRVPASRPGCALWRQHEGMTQPPQHPSLPGRTLRMLAWSAATPQASSSAAQQSEELFWFALSSSNS